MVIKMLAIKTEAGYYKEGDPYMMVDLPRASVYPPEKAEYVQGIMTGLKQQGVASRLVEMHISLTEWEDISAWRSSQI
jgi:hypothetical protein